MTSSLLKTSRARWRRLGWPWRIAAILFALAVPAPVVLLLIFRFVPVPFTPQMALTLLSGEAVHQVWVGRDIAPALTRAVIASEDERFCFHDGFDWTSIDKAIAAHDKGRRLRGASTISQQTARTIFLLPLRSWVRKGVEAWLTVLMEALWPKQRILTAYLNLVDWGHGNFGAEAAAEAYFHKHAADLTTMEAARLAVILPDPDSWNAARPGPYVRARTRTILEHMGWVSRDGLDRCLRP